MTEVPEEYDDAQVDRGPEHDRRTGRGAAAERISHRRQFVDLQIQQAMARGDFDNLPGAGKPIADLGASHDPDWWLKKLIERERITGVLPPALQLRKDDLELDDQLDNEPLERRVRELLKEFNHRVVEARRQLLGGPPVVTRLRDVEAEVEGWRTRRAVRRRGV
ncbi:MAG: DUF1992 domain-containing protein [Actinomycetota bacterium]|nr:DUF1992 domain-containing protein [Actinomycetota bacterium]